MSDAKRYVLYARKSSESEDRQVLSIPAQLKELRSLASRSGISISEELTESCSAREPGRPVFSKLLTAVAAGRIYGIVCWKLDRLARNPIDGGALTHYLGKGLLHEIVTSDGRHDGTGDSKFMLSVLFGAATKYTDDLSANVKRGNRDLCESGRLPGTAPLGYLKVHDDPGREGAGRVVRDPERFLLMQRVWKDIAAGTTTVAGAWRQAVANGLTTRPTRKNPSHPVLLNHLYKILGSKFYTGQIVRGSEVFQGEHEPMVTLDEFDRVQSVVRRKDGPRPSLHRFLYSGLLRCGHCGRALIGEDIENRYGRHYTYYRCGRKRQGFAVCRAPAPTEKRVTTDVEAALAASTIPEPLVEWTLDAVDCWAQEQREHAVAIAKAKEADLRKAEHDHKRLTDLVVAGTLDDQEYLERRAESVARLERLRRSVENPSSEVEAWQKAMAEFVVFGGLLSKSFAEGDIDEKRSLLGRVYENLLVTDRITKPALRFEARALEGKFPLAPERKGGDVNLPPPSKIVLNERKNARPRGARERAFQAWWARVCEVRTFWGKDSLNEAA